MFNLSVVQQAEIVVILAIILLAAYIFYRLNLFKKE
jgi:flagellar biogenesis protein FliO